MKPIRIKEHYVVARDPVTGGERILEANCEQDVLSDQGSIDTYGKRQLSPCDCGCFRPPGGRCYSCGALTCVECFGRCRTCAAPLCLEHSIFVETPGGGTLRFCRRCHDKLLRRRRLASFARVILSPFIGFGQ